jgi:hypothetical protein
MLGEQRRSIEQNAPAGSRVPWSIVIDDITCWKGTDNPRPEMRWVGCDTHQTITLDVVRRPKTTIHELERCMRCKDCQGG